MTKKVDVRNKRIDGLREELTKMKDDFHEFKMNSTMDAYFQKHTDVVMRIGRKQEDYMKDLVGTVNDFLKHDDQNQQQEMMDEARQISRDAEASGAAAEGMEVEELPAWGD